MERLSYVHKIPDLYDVFLYTGIPAVFIASFSSGIVIPENKLKIVEYCPQFLRSYYMFWALSILEKFLYGSTFYVARGREFVNQSLMLQNNW